MRGAVDYLIDTQDPASRAGLDREAIARWSSDTTWLGLEIVATEGGGAQEEEGIVEFIARGATRVAPFAQHERSRFPGAAAAGTTSMARSSAIRSGPPRRRAAMIHARAAAA